MGGKHHVRSAVCPDGLHHSLEIVLPFASCFQWDLPVVWQWIKALVHCGINGSGVLEKLVCYLLNELLVS